METPRLRLRDLTLDDIDGLLAIFGDGEAMRYYPSTKSRDETVAWIEAVLESYDDNGFGLWAVESKADGRFLGECGLTLQPVDGEPVPEIGYHLLRHEWGKGYATEAAVACRDWLFRETASARVVSIVDPLNAPSRRVAERVHVRMRMFEWERKPDREMCLYETTRADLAAPFARLPSFKRRAPVRAPSG